MPQFDSNAIDFSQFADPKLPEENNAEHDALATIRAEYQWITCLQDMPEAELRHVLEEGRVYRDQVTPGLEDTLDVHYIRRYRVARIVAEARGLVK